VTFLGKKGSLFSSRFLDQSDCAERKVKFKEITGQACTDPEGFRRFFHSLVFSLRDRVGRNQSPVM